MTLRTSLTRFVYPKSWRNLDFFEEATLSRLLGRIINRPIEVHQ